jgi:hypothetical protein
VWLTRASRSASRKSPLATRTDRRIAVIGEDQGYVKRRPLAEMASKLTESRATAGGGSRQFWRPPDIPKRWTPVGTSGLEQNFSGHGEDVVGIHAHYPVRAVFNGRGTLCVLAECQAGHAEHGSLFLHSAGVGENQASVIVHVEKIEVAERVQWEKAGGCRCFLGKKRPRPKLSIFLRVRGCTGKKIGKSVAIALTAVKMPRSN